MYFSKTGMDMVAAVAVEEEVTDTGIRNMDMVSTVKHHASCCGYSVSVWKAIFTLEVITLTIILIYLQAVVVEAVEGKELQKYTRNS